VPRIVEAHRGSARRQGGPQIRGETGGERGGASHETATTKACAHDRPPIAGDGAAPRPVDEAAAR
jgi:hypothetical protein